MALKWSVTEKFHDYLYGTSFEMYTDNNPLTYVFSFIVEKAEARVPDDILLSTALTAQDWQKAQAADSDINYVIGALLEGNHPSPEQVKSHKVDLGYLPDW